jgi:Predicted membrane protein (DUF2207)
MTAGHAAFAALGAVLAGGWLAVLAVLRQRTPPPDVPAQPPTGDLGPEPPAVAGMLIRNGHVGDQAAAAILLDLAARQVIGLDQVGQQLTLRVPPGPDREDLASYERRVLSQVRALAHGGVLPAQALADGDESAPGWRQDLASDVVADARDRGLATQRFSSATAARLVMLAALAGTAFGLALAGPPAVGGAIAGIIVGAVGGALAGGLLASLAGGADRLTAAGAAAAGHWLGVRAYLAADSSLAAQPPTAVARYGRHLSYAAALGLADAAVRALPAGEPASARTVLTPDGGDEWRRVEVTYLRGSSYGSSPASLIYRRLFVTVMLAFWAFVLIWAVPSMLSGSGRTLAVVARDVSPVAGVVAVLLAGWALAGALLAAAGLAATETVEGVVVRKHYIGSSGEGSSADHWIAVDDRTGPTVAAWKVRPGIYQRVSETDMVRASVTRRYRYVYRVQVLARRESPAG